MATSYSIIDTLTIQDSLKLLEPGSAFNLDVDVLFLQDTLAAPTFGLTVKISDTFTFADAAVNTIKFAIPIPIPSTTPDRILLVDLVEVALNSGNIPIAVFDHLNFNDFQAGGNTNSPAAVDSLSLSDLLLSGQNWTVSPDSLSLSDAATATFTSIFLNQTISATDALALADALGLAASGKFTVFSDILILRDFVSINFGSSFLPYLRRYLNDV